MTNNKYLAALLGFAFVAITAFQASASGGFTEVEVYQLAALAAGNVIVFFVPLLEKGWAGAIKTTFAVLAAVLTAIIPLLSNAWTPETIAIVVLAGVNALATELGVEVRVDTAKAGLVSPAINNRVVYEVDSKAGEAAVNQINGIADKAGI